MFSYTNLYIVFLKMTILSPKILKQFGTAISFYILFKFLKILTSTYFTRLASPDLFILGARDTVFHITTNIRLLFIKTCRVLEFSYFNIEIEKLFSKSRIFKGCTF